VLNAFTPKQASRIVGMSTHMLNYLARQNYLVPTYFRTKTRGRTRYYSYRDLVVARLIQRLLDAGLELGRLKEGLARLSRDEFWAKGGQKDLRLLMTDGRNLYLVQGHNTLLDLTRQGQLAFAFVLDVVAARQEIELKMAPEEKRNFSLKNKKIRYA
jgi:DNA-binding transcriptional MerR regulator